MEQTAWEECPPIHKQITKEQFERLVWNMNMVLKKYMSDSKECEDLLVRVVSQMMQETSPDLFISLHKWHYAEATGGDAVIDRIYWSIDLTHDRIKVEAAVKVVNAVGTMHARSIEAPPQFFSPEAKKPVSQAPSKKEEPEKKDRSGKQKKKTSVGDGRKKMLEPIAGVLEPPKGPTLQKSVQQSEMDSAPARDVLNASVSDIALESASDTSLRSGNGGEA
jgi:hypothetical protein